MIIQFIEGPFDGTTLDVGDSSLFHAGNYITMVSPDNPEHIALYKKESVERWQFVGFLEKCVDTH